MSPLTLFSFFKTKFLNSKSLELVDSLDNFWKENEANWNFCEICINNVAHFVECSHLNNISLSDLWLRDNFLFACVFNNIFQQYFVVHGKYCISFICLFQKLFSFCCYYKLNIFLDCSILLCINKIDFCKLIYPLL